MSSALDAKREHRADGGFKARVVWITTAAASGLLVVAASASILDNFRRGYFPDQLLGLHLFPVSMFSVAILAAAGLLLRSSVRPQVFHIAIAIHLAFVAAGLFYGHGYREQVIQDVVVRAEQAVDAINAFKRKYGHAPAELKELVPEFLATSPESLLECTAVLWYSVDPSTGAWRIQHNPCEWLGLDYSPAPLGRPLQEHERRIGNWIVEDRMR